MITCQHYVALIFTCSACERCAIRRQVCLTAIQRCRALIVQLASQQPVRHVRDSGRACAILSISAARQRPTPRFMQPLGHPSGLFMLTLAL